MGRSSKKNIAQRGEVGEVFKNKHNSKGGRWGRLRFCSLYSLESRRPYYSLRGVADRGGGGEGPP